MLILFIALIAGPIVAGSKILTPNLEKIIPKGLLQPVGQNNNDTNNYTETGTGAKSGVSASAMSASSGNAKVRLF